MWSLFRALSNSYLHYFIISACIVLSVYYLGSLVAGGRPRNEAGLFLSLQTIAPLYPEAVQAAN